mmetsp:Transcript_8985/g.18402  ORF Transcript_8985/g.18402 Transcript_8985/m.18402 type:complete len:99 (-) Transcript_8985:524-820(-)
MMGREGMAVPESNSSDSVGSSDGKGDRQDSRRGHCRYDATDSDDSVFLNPTHGVPGEGGITEGVGEDALTVVLEARCAVMFEHDLHHPGHRQRECRAR